MPILIIAVIIAGWLSYFISSKVYAGLKRNESKYARLIQVIVGLVIFGLLIIGVAAIIISQIHFTR